MHSKIAGFLLLILGGYFAADAERQHNDVLSAQIYPLVAIFLAMTVRVLQAEKHHRENHREPEPQALPTGDKEAFSRN